MMLEVLVDWGDELWDVVVCGEVYLGVYYFLFGKKGGRLEDVRRVYSYL